jgi:drug/metabolite transporter (DMT)-like permease
VIHARHGPILVVIFAASLWGLFWLPLRGFEEMGLAAGWATLSQLSTPALFLVPLALWRATGGRATGLGQPVTGLLIGGAFALYAESLLLTEVARALILFYVTPVWSTFLELTVMKRRVTGPRALALVLGLGGLFVILGGKTGIPLPRNLGDVMALLSGMLWAVGSMRIRQSPDRGTFEHLFSFFVYGSLVALGFYRSRRSGRHRPFPNWPPSRPGWCWPRSDFSFPSCGASCGGRSTWIRAASASSCNWRPSSASQAPPS